MALASAFACGGSSDGDDGLGALPDRHDDHSHDSTDTPVDPSKPDGGNDPVGPKAFAVGAAVVVAPSGFVPRGITTSGDVLLSRDDGNGKISYHAVPAKGGSTTPIEENLSAADCEALVSGDVVEIRKAPPSSTLGPMSIWSRASGLKALGTVVRHYYAFTSSPDGKRIAYVTSKGELKVGTFAATANAATGINVQSEPCIPHVEFVGDTLVTSTCAATTSQGGDLRVWDTNGAAKTIAAPGTLAYNDFSSAGTASHVFFDNGQIGSPLSLLDLATGTTTALETGRASSAVLSRDAKLAIYRSSKRDELRVWRNGASATLVDRASSFRMSPDEKWIVTTRTYPSPAKMLLVDVASGAQTEIADNAYTAYFSGDGKRFLYRVGSDPGMKIWDIAAKSTSDAGVITNFIAVPGHPEGFALECPSTAAYDDLVCTLSVIDTATKTKKVLDTNTTKSLTLEAGTLLYRRADGIVTRPVSY